MDCHASLYLAAILLDATYISNMLWLVLQVACPSAQQVVAFDAMSSPHRMQQQLNLSSTDCSRPTTIAFDSSNSMYENPDP